jgi:type IV pilus assembly protein PilE
MRRLSTGFTLVELMVVCVVAALLLAIAIPAYNSQVRKSRRTDAKSATMDLAGREERYYSTQNAYTATAANLGYAALPSNVDNNYYAINVTVPRAGAPANTASYLVTTTPVAGNGQDQDTTCAAFSVDELGRRSAVDGAGNDATATCWR